MAKEQERDIREDREKNDHDRNIEQAQKAGKHGVRTDIYAEGDGFLGMDDLDRMRRKDWVRD